MTLEETQKKIEELQKRHAAVLKRKSENEGRLKAKREELAALVADIKAAGRDPKTLVADRDAALKDLEALVAAFETDIAFAETALATFDKK